MTRWRWIAALTVLALLTCGRIALIDGLQDQGYFAKYPTFADRILAGELPRARLGDLSPLYLWLTVFFRFLGMDGHTIRTLQIIVLSAGALLCALAAKRFGGWMAAIATAVLILGNRAALVTASDLEPETLIFVLIAGAIALLATRSTAAGFLLGLAAIARPVALIALVLIAAWLFLRARRDALRFAGAALVPIAAILILNLSLIGSAIIMQPGTVFYEGNNPLSTGCSGVMPRIVADLNASSPEPDYLHVAYRLVASRATGRPMSPRDANRYWSGKALAWMRFAPRAALANFGWKALLSIHNYDVYDLATSQRKADELARFPAIPFGLIVALGFAAFILRKERRELVPLVLFAAATLVALITFVVTARQRNALLPPLAVMAGVGVAEIVRKKNLLAFGAVAMAAAVLGIEGAPQREDRYNWQSSFQADQLRRTAYRTRDRVRATELAAWSSILDVAGPPIVTPRTLHSLALAALANTPQPERRFDLAIALMKAGAYREADAVLASLRDYHPRRENRAVSSVAYYRARCAIALHQRPDIAAAKREAPGDPHVLALAGDIRHLDELHDPFTRDRALGRPVHFPEWMRRAARN